EDADVIWWGPQTWDWGDLTKTVVGAGLGTAIVQVLPAICRDIRHRKAHAAVMAVRLAVILEAYAAACLDLIARNNDAEAPPDEEYPYWETSLPELPAYPDDIEGWRTI